MSVQTLERQRQTRKAFFRRRKIGSNIITILNQERKRQGNFRLDRKNINQINFLLMTRITSKNNNFTMIFQSLFPKYFDLSAFQQVSVLSHQRRKDEKKLLQGATLATKHNITCLHLFENGDILNLDHIVV